MIEGSEIRTVVSTGDTVIVERVDVNSFGGLPGTFHVVALYEVHCPDRDCLIHGI
ncbi:hypothetical protein [Mycobacterium sherrisii]|nr:hypothetical protein [Mycobacterium sherrisii]